MHVTHPPCRRETRKASNVSPEALLFVSVLAAEALASSAILGANGTIIDNQSLRNCCLTGSLFGAVLAIAFESEIAKVKRQENGNELRALARRLLASLIGGVIFAPALMRYFKVELDPDIVFIWSGVTAFASVATLQIVSGIYRRAIKKYLEDKAAAIVGPLDDDSPSSPPSV